MGTPTQYAQRVPKAKWTPPDEQLAAEIDEIVALFEGQQEIEAKYKAALAKVMGPEGDRVPIAYLAERLGVERKTVYRHLGRPMK